MKNRRLIEFQKAIDSLPSNVERWRDLADDPNAPAAIAFRARTLRDAWRDEIPDRAGFLIERARGRRVLDVGCVAHDLERMKSPDWLHRRLAAVAERCVGVDILADGIATMRELGFDAVNHDLSDGAGPLAALRPFDLIIAGELIEHVPDLTMLFRAAQQLLSADGELILTTPNPYAPSRVLAGQRGDCFENVDHIIYAFPGGIAELAERHNLVLREAATTAPRRADLSPSSLVRSMKRRIRGTTWLRLGFTTRDKVEVVRIRGPIRRSRRSSSSRLFVGETFVYVVGRRRTAVSDGGV